MVDGIGGFHFFEPLFGSLRCLQRRERIVFQYGDYQGLAVSRGHVYAAVGLPSALDGDIDVGRIVFASDAESLGQGLQTR